jgi:hypothetical protein
MRFVALGILVLCGCATGDGWRPASLASVPALAYEVSTGSHPEEDLAMGIDGAMLLPSPDGGEPLAVPHQIRATGERLQLVPSYAFDNPARALPGLNSLLWERSIRTAPQRSGVELYRTRQLKLLIGTRTLIDEFYPDPVLTDPRHDPLGLETAAVVGLRLGF